MKKKLLVLLLALCCTTCLSENPRWKGMGTRIPVCTNLNVQWNASADEFPSEIWVYHLRP